MLTKARLVALHGFQCRPDHPLVHRTDVVLLARVGFNIEDLGIAVHGRPTCACRGKKIGASPAAAPRRHVSKIDAELLPTSSLRTGWGAFCF